MRSSIRRTTLTWIALVATALFAIGCTAERKPQRSSKPSTPVLSEEERQAEIERRRLADVKKRYDRCLDYMRKEPTDYLNHIQRFEIVLAGARGTEFEAKCNDRIQELRKGLEELALDQFKGVAEAADRRIAEDDWLGAEEELALFRNNEQVFRETPAWKLWEAKLEQVKIGSTAEFEAGQVSRRAREYRAQLELDKAIGLLVSYPDKYKGTRYYDEIQEFIAEYMEEYLAARQEKEAEVAIPFVDVTIDEYLGEFQVTEAGEVEVWKGVDGVAEGVNETEDRAQLLLGSTADAEEKWVDYVVEFEIKYGGDEALRLGVTCGKRNVWDKFPQYSVYTMRELDEDTWHKLRIDVRDGKVQIIDVESADILKDSLKSFHTGGMAFFLMPHQQVYVRAVRYKVLKSEKAGEAEGDDGGDDGAGKAAPEGDGGDGQ